MFELITQIIILVGIYYLVRYVLLTFIDRRYLTWLGGIVLVALMVLAFLDPTNRTIGILWSIISFPLRPLGLVILLLAYGARLGVNKIDGSPAVAALIILLITSLPITAYLLTAQTEQQSVVDAINRREIVRDVQAIVVLGDSPLPSDANYRIRTQLSNAANGVSTSLQTRLLYAVQLYADAGTNPSVIVSTGPQPPQLTGATSETDAVTAFLVSNGIPADRVRIDTEGVDPRSSAIAVRRLFAGPGADCELFATCPDGNVQQVPNPTLAGPRIPIILVSPALSIRRATSTFTNVNFTVTPRPSEFYVFQFQRGLEFASLTDLVPNAEALAVTSRVIDEYLATVYYFLRGWLADPLGV